MKTIHLILPTHFKWKLLLLMLLTQVGFSFAQNRTVSGLVMGSNGKALKGVVVSVEGSDYGSVTDLQGKYSTLVASTKDARLNFSSFGWKTKSVEVRGSQVVDIVMEEDHGTLDLDIERTIQGKVTGENGEALVGVRVQIQNSDYSSLTDFNGNYSILVDDETHKKLVFTLNEWDTKVESIEGKTRLDVTLTPEVVDPSQEITVTGTVSDPDGVTLPGVVVKVAGSDYGSITDFNGKYTTLIKNASTAYLQFSSLGYEPQMIKVNNRAVIDVILKPSVKELEEVLVVGYATQKKTDLTGAVSTVDTEILHNELATTIDQALKGKIAGVQIVNTDGAAGAGMQIKVRGTNSLTAGSSPLYVIDGFPYPISDDPTQNPLVGLSPEMIEEIVVLKDASSTAIYGSQGANGVVLITTKSAKEGQKEVTFKVTSGISKMTNNLDMLSPEEYLNNLMYANLGKQELDFEEEFLTEAWNDPSKVTNWVDEIFRVAKRYGADFSFRTSTKKMQNSMFLSLSNDEGILMNNDYKRANLRYNTGIEINDKLRLNANLTFDINQRTGANWFVGGIFNNANTFSPFIPKEFTHVNMGEYLPNFNGNDNPYRQVNDPEFTRVDMRPSVDFNLSYNIGKGLSFVNSIGGSYMSIEEKSYLPPTLKAAYETNGRASYQNYDMSTWRYLGQLNYSATFMPKGHTLRTVAAFEARGNVINSYAANHTNFATDAGWHGINDLVIGDHIESPDLIYRSHSLASLIGRMDYSFKDRYLVTATVRTDGSSRFGDNRKWGVFPSAAFAWRLSEEPFFQKSDFLSNTFSQAKFRVSYGVVGNDQINDYQYANFLATLDRYAIFGGDGNESSVIPYNQTDLGNPNVTWETSKELNIGYDFGLFKDRITFSGEMYHKVTTDMLLNQRLPMLSGFEDVTLNTGSVQNRGVEFTINAHVVNKKDFGFDMGFNISANRSEVLSLGQRDQLLLNRNVGHANSENILLKEGYPIGLYFGYVLNGIMNDEYSHHNAPTSDVNPVAPEGQDVLDPTKSYPNGNFMFMDIDGDGRITDFDRMPLAHVEPDFIGGLNFYFRYKIVDLGFSFSYSYGNDILNGNIVSLISTGQGINNELSLIADNKWNGRNRDGTYTEDGLYRRYSNSEVVEDGSFLRLNNISLGIRMPEKYLSALNLNSCRLLYSARNVFTWTRYSGYDPEVNTSVGGLANNLQTRFLNGVDVSSYPTATTHSIALNFTF